MTDTSLAPYYDDFDEDKGFGRMLFRPSRAVQARELTQLQTILQNQITRFGQNIFLDGSVVVPGGVSVDTKYEYLTISDAELGGVVSGATLIGNTSNMIAQVIQTVPAEDSDPVTLYVRYTGGGGSDGGRFQAGETVTWTNPETGSGSYTATGSGTGTKVDLNKGIYFVSGVFVAAISQSLIVEKYGIPAGIQEIGLTYEQSIVTSNDDSSLLDNANGTNNKNAPGADRLKNALSLIKKADVVEGQDYFTIVTLKDEEIVEQLIRSQYALLGDELARRTFDESGNYTVEPFLIRASEHETDETLLDLTIDTGKAYVRGYEIDKPLATVLETRRALDTDLQNNGRISTFFGNYVRSNNVTGMPRLDYWAQHNLVNASSTTIGQCKVRYVEKESDSVYRIYIFDVAMNQGETFADVETISGDGFVAGLINLADLPVTGDTRLLESARNSLLFRVPHDRVSSVQDITVRVQRWEEEVSNGSGEITLDSNSPNQTWAEFSSWIIAEPSGAVATGVSATATGAQTITLSGLTANTTYRIIGYVDKTTATSSARAKTLNTVTTGIGVITNGVVNLAQYDIFDVTQVLDDNGVDITNNFRLDNGQRDNFYDFGRLVLKSGVSAPVMPLSVTFSYFSHGTGDYFSADSYNSLLALPEYSYKDIPFHKAADGSFQRLSEYFDFRPKKGTNDRFNGTVSSINELPRQNDSIQGDIVYYLPRLDIVYLDNEGRFGISEGNPALEPVLPAFPDNAMAIYQVLMNAGTLNQNDIRLSFIENRRYTMRDIGKIEDRITRLEEFTTLSALETSTAAFEVLDENGNNRFKSGFFVDNFNDHAFADFLSSEYRSSIDPVEGAVRPTFVESNTRLIYKTSTPAGSSSGVVRNGDTLTLSYTEELEIDQPLASSTINVNPYSVITGIGAITISPETDEWRDVETRTVTNTIQEDRRVNPVQQGNWNNWGWNWAGINIGPITPDAAGLGSGRGGGSVLFEQNMERF